MFDQKEIIKWNDSYDDYTYPYRIYYELVINKKKYKTKMELMGAWKTGSLRLTQNGQEYIDENGCFYSFTGRWKKEAPVGFNTWKYISDSYTEIKERIPQEFSEIRKPEIVSDLESKQGFGFIWTVFVLHCIYPEVYPLYDQHVYRAYHHITDNKDKRIRQAPSEWSEYVKYRNFFINKVKETTIEYWKIDRALWAYGKYIKQGYKNSADFRCSQIEKGNKAARNKIDAIQNLDKDWIHSVTLGGKKKSFWWKINVDGSLSISRNFNFKNVGMKVDAEITENELYQISEYVKNDWICLSNNVDKLKNGTEKDGLGKFVYSSLGWDTTKSQLSSQLFALFTNSDIWEDNGKTRNIQVKRRHDDWKEMLNIFYIECLTD